MWFCSRRDHSVTKYFFLRKITNDGIETELAQRSLWKLYPYAFNHKKMNNWIQTCPYKQFWWRSSRSSGWGSISDIIKTIHERVQSNRRLKVLEIAETVAISIECNRNDFLHQLIAIDETWIHHISPKTKEQSKKWVSRNESALLC